MALSFFKQRDIDEMDIYDIPEEFINYVDTLDDKAKSALLEKRPDLAKALGIELTTQAENDLNITSIATSDFLENGTENVEDTAADDTLGTETLEISEAKEDASESDELYRKISQNYYEGTSVLQALKDNMEHFEALTIPPDTELCIIHRERFQKKQIRFISKKKKIFSIVVKVCEQCNRAFLEGLYAGYVREQLSYRNISHMIYDIELSTRYLQSKIKTHKFAQDEMLYVPDTWIEENPICPIHECKLFETKCEHSYKDRKITFNAFYCDLCDKLLLRRASMISLLDQCHEIGLPEIQYEKLAKKKPKKKSVKLQNTKPQYCVENGKRTEFHYDSYDEYYRLNEEDTIVVGDSIYCELENHETEEVPGLIWVQEKKKGRKLYLFLLGYCAQCQKYYMDIDDYKLVYALGRPEVTVILDIDDSEFQITSGEVFSIEKDHLGNLERGIDGEITTIKGNSDYVNPFATGDYDDGNLSFAKDLSKRKYGPRLEELHGYISKPYMYRVDISTGDETEVYYVGASDVEVGGKLQVISANSELGHDLINYQTIKVKNNGKEYDIKLSRQFDIEQATLYGYTNLRTDEDLIFKSGITDPFLVRVLNMRKRQHNMTDIFVTIQENQNKIVDTDFTKNLIVQGCAGSGKTMVLLHRLSSLKYKQRYFDFGRDALILTPNEQFSLHIKGLAEGLQIGNIERASVEQYYIERLLEYDSSFRPDRQLASEQNVSQIFVDYIYSDLFKVNFETAFERVISERNAFAEILDNLTDAMGEKKRNIDFSQNARVIQQIRFGVDAMDVLVRQQEQSAERAKAELEKQVSRKQFLEGKLPETRENISKIVKEILPSVNGKIYQYLSEKQAEVEENNQSIQRLTDEQGRVQRTIIMIGKRARLRELETQIDDATRKKEDAQKLYDAVQGIFEQYQEDKSDDEVVAWMGRLIAYIPSVREEIRRFNDAKESFLTYLTEYGEIDTLINSAQIKYDDETEKLYSDEVKNAIRYLYEKCDEYSLQNTFKKVFDAAVADFMRDYEVKQPQGKYYRYVLYAQLLFAMKFYGEVHGETRFICVDEGQDLAINEYRLIYELNRRNMVFNIFGDVNQLIKPGRGIKDWGELAKLFHATEYRLNENYRNTNQITRFCNDSFGMKVLRTGVDGAAVREIPRKELEHELNIMKLGTERVAVLLPRSIQKKIYLQRDLISVAKLGLIGDNMENGYIALMYVDEVKGIEFDRVFVVANGMTKNEKYIAYTRALSELILVVDENIKAPEPESEPKRRIPAENIQPETEKIGNKPLSNFSATNTKMTALPEDTESVQERTNSNLEVKSKDSSDNDRSISIKEVLQSSAEIIETPGLSELKRIAGSGLNQGTYMKGNFSDEDIMSMFSEFFSSLLRKDTSYKYAFFKCILDCVPKLDEDLVISFDELFGRFTEIYWPLVVNYDIHQKVGDLDSRSYVEQLLLETVEDLGVSYDIKFDELSNKQQKDLIKKVKQKCKTNVVGALYGDTKQLLYSFDKKKEWLKLNPLFYSFVQRHGDELQEMNYHAWAFFISKVNNDLKKSQVKKKANLKNIDGAVNVYRAVLNSTFMLSIPLLSVIVPILDHLMKAS